MLILYVCLNLNANFEQQIGDSTFFASNYKFLIYSAKITNTWFKCGKNNEHNY